MAERTFVMACLYQCMWGLCWLDKFVVEVKAGNRFRLNDVRLFGEKILTRELGEEFFEMRLIRVFVRACLVFVSLKSSARCYYENAKLVETPYVSTMMYCGSSASSFSVIR